MLLEGKSENILSLRAAKRFAKNPVCFPLSLLLDIFV